jgi:hypothetical protein
LIAVGVDVLSTTYRNWTVFLLSVLVAKFVISFAVCCVFSDVYPHLLHEGLSPIASDVDCNTLNRPFFNQLTQVCAGYADGHVEAGYGDSGGPLLSLVRLFVGFDVAIFGVDSEILRAVLCWWFVAVALICSCVDDI